MMADRSKNLQYSKIIDDNPPNDEASDNENADMSGHDYVHQIALKVSKFEANRKIKLKRLEKFKKA